MTASPFSHKLFFDRGKYIWWFATREGVLHKRPKTFETGFQHIVSTCRNANDIELSTELSTGYEHTTYCVPLFSFKYIVYVCDFSATSM